MDRPCCCGRRHLLPFHRRAARLSEQLGSSSSQLCAREREEGRPPSSYCGKVVQQLPERERALCQSVDCCSCRCRELFLLFFFFNAATSFQLYLVEHTCLVSAVVFIRGRSQTKACLENSQRQFNQWKITGLQDAVAFGCLLRRCCIFSPDSV